MVSAMTSTSTREGEQGDPFMPLLLSLVVHDVLATVKARVFAGECSMCVEPAPDRVRVQHVGSSVPQQSRRPVAHRQDTRVEQCWSAVQIHRRVDQGKFAGGEEVLGGFVVSSRLPVRVANSPPVRRFEVPPLIVHNPAQSVIAACRRS